MTDFNFPFGFMTTSGYGSPSKELGWLLSAFAGIVMCKIVYESTGVISLSLFKGYTKLDDAQKLEWNNRGFSTFHAFIVAVASVYILLVSNFFDEGSQTELITYRTSTLSNTILGISLGYFMSDLAMILWNFPALGGLEYVLHHGLSIFSLFQSLVSGQAHFYTLMILFTEATTPFVNLRWYLDVAGKKKSNLYTCNGVAMFLGWLVQPTTLNSLSPLSTLPSHLFTLLDSNKSVWVARILLFVFFFYHMLIHFDQVKEVYPLGFYSLLVIPPVLTMMNMFWFWKITKGLIKTLSKARHSA